MLYTIIGTINSRTGDDNSDVTYTIIGAFGASQTEDEQVEQVLSQLYFIER